jgi:two-component system, cell cycle response regulator PopA
MIYPTFYLISPGQFSGSLSRRTPKERGSATSPAAIPKSFMNDLAFLDPPIEVLAAGARLEMILSRLRSGRMRPFRADFPIARNSAEALLVDTLSLDGAMLDQFVDSLSGSFRPVLILGDPSFAGHFANAVCVPRDRDLSVLRGRLDAVTRRSARLSEFLLRSQTATDFGVDLPVPVAEAVPDLLYLGDGSSRFLALQAALSERGITVTAAFSAHTAADYVKQKVFAAILIDITPESQSLDRLANWATGSVGKVEDTPLFGLLDPSVEPTPALETLMSHMSQVFDHGTAARDLAAHVESHGRRLHLRSTGACDDGALAKICHAETGLFAQKFFEAHLQNQIDLSAERGDPLTVLVICDPEHDRLLPRERNLLAETVLTGVRETDLPATIDPDTFAISLSATSYKGAVHICERLFRQLEVSAPHLAARLGWRITEKRAYHDAHRLLSEARSGVYQKSRTG